MEKESNLRSMLGLTQNEMAQILNVSRSLYSMYELGKRDLPPASKEMLAGILAYLQDPETEEKNKEYMKAHEKEVEEHREQAVKDLLLENQQKRHLLDKKIAKNSSFVQKSQSDFSSFDES